MLALLLPIDGPPMLIDQPDLYPYLRNALGFNLAAREGRAWIAYTSGLANAANAPTNLAATELLAEVTGGSVAPVYATVVLAGRTDDGDGDLDVNIIAIAAARCPGGVLLAA